MHLAVVACGNRLDETLTMVKSALLFSIKKIKFHIFAEEDLTEQFQKGVRGDSMIFFTFYCSFCVNSNVFTFLFLEYLCGVFLDLPFNQFTVLPQIKGTVFFQHIKYKYFFCIFSLKCHSLQFFKCNLLQYSLQPCS